MDCSPQSPYQKFKQNFLKENCKRCALCEGRTQLVFDRGNSLSKILIIGEAPGAEEDKMGQCFVGRAGKVLDQVMASIGLDTNQDTLIINVVKCRPPGNRPPKPEEAAQCAGYLEKQIRLCNPEIILLLGRTALKHILPEKAKLPMKEMVGQLFDGFLFEDKIKIPCLLLYHPAYLLYDPRKRVDMLSHLQLLEKVLNKGTKTKPSQIC